MHTPLNCVCACALCRRPLFEEDVKADHHVYKLGELSYIELAHRECAVKDNAERKSSYWAFDEDSQVHEVGTFTYAGVDFSVEVETFPPEHDPKTADIHALFNPDLGDIDEFTDDDFLGAIEAWLRIRLAVPDLRLIFRESGAQSHDMVALERIA